MTPNAAPNSTHASRVARKPLPSAKSESTSPMKTPSQTPESRPPTATRPVVSRPVIRSIRLSSVPTIMHCSTGNLLSERKSTVFCAAA